MGNVDILKAGYGIPDDSADDKLHEECGVFGLWAPPEADDAADEVYRGLLALQHRGQESAGITVGKGEGLRTEKGMGLISQVFSAGDLEE